VKKYLLLALIILPGTPAMADDGAELFKSKTCNTCHGAQGKAPIHPSYPELAGQQKDYLIAQLKAFRAKERTNSNAALMWGMAQNLTDEEIEKLAEYLSAQ